MGVWRAQLVAQLVVPVPHIEDDIDAAEAAVVRARLRVRVVRDRVHAMHARTSCSRERSKRVSPRLAWTRRVAPRRHEVRARGLRGDPQPRARLRELGELGACAST